ncbi:xylose isomerase domain-containing protein TIM barrel [Salmonella enterica subsp. enterica]|uniref:Xylose isomerase domain-containing protein TIM barrel n=1 Tax=Salmonella enterica I TaxID=59201 RepID=A0A379X180_SALET|nr:xylose isomerase domain-containing protein TIM barrel [Salmonella enterica subsp. enterica]
MNIEKTRFCINRKIAPGLSIEAFFRLVKRLDFNKVNCVMICQAAALLMT